MGKLFKDKSITVYAPVELTLSQKRLLQEALEKLVGENPDVSYVIDKSLIGGLRVEIGTRIIDFSVSSKIEG